MNKLIVAIAALVLGAACQAFAQPPPGDARTAVRAACAEDGKTLCPNAQSRDERRQCMMQNRDKTSDGCKAAMAQFRARPAPNPPPGAGG